MPTSNLVLVGTVWDGFTGSSESYRVVHSQTSASLMILWAGRSLARPSNGCCWLLEVRRLSSSSLVAFSLGYSYGHSKIQNPLTFL